MRIPLKTQFPKKVFKTFRMCLGWGHPFVYCKLDDLVFCFEEKTYFGKLEFFDGNGYCHQFWHIDLKVHF